MAVAKWNTPSAQGANIAGTTLNSLANGAASAFVTYDNSANLDLYASVEIDLGSFTSTTGATITLAVFPTANAGASVPDNTAALGGGDQYTVPVTVGASAKVAIIPMVRLYPCSMRLAVVNNAGAAFAASANQLKVQPFNENVT